MKVRDRTGLRRRLPRMLHRNSRLQNDFRAVAASGGHFHERRRQGHADVRLDAAWSRDRPPPGRDFPPKLRSRRATLFESSENFVQRAALFECARHLQIFQLQENRIMRETGERFGMGTGGNADIRADPASARIGYQKVGSFGPGTKKRPFKIARKLRRPTK